MIASNCFEMPPSVTQRGQKSVTADYSNAAFRDLRYGASWTPIDAGLDNERVRNQQGAFFGLLRTVYDTPRVWTPLVSPASITILFNTWHSKTMNKTQPTTSEKYTHVRNLYPPETRVKLGYPQYKCSIEMRQRDQITYSPHLSFSFAAALCFACFAAGVFRDA